MVTVVSSQVLVREASRSWLVRPREAPEPGRKNSSVYGSSSESSPAPQNDTSLGLARMAAPLPLAAD